MKFHKKGVSTLGEFIILIGVILASTLFLLSFQQTITKETDITKRMKGKEITERISDLINRHRGGPSHVMYSVEVPKISVRVEDGVLTVEKDEKTFSQSVTENSKDVFLNNTYKVIILKQNDQIILTDKAPTCNYNFECEPKECFSDCEDCYGPSEVCIGDGNCTKAIDENCENSPQDCVCENGKKCCPTHPDSDENSCLQIIEERDRGKQCYCDNQCSGNLKCNPTRNNFDEFEKACCPAGKGWNGDECVYNCNKGSYERFACKFPGTYNRYLDVCHPTVKSKIESWILSDPNLRNQVSNNKYDNAVRKIWKKSFQNLYNQNYCFPACTGNRKPVNRLIDGSVSCGVCNHWAAVGTSLIRTMGVPKNRVYSLAFVMGGGGHAVTGYKSDSGEWWILDYTCCKRLVKAKNWDSCGRCECDRGQLMDNDYYSGGWKINKVGGIC